MVKKPEDKLQELVSRVHYACGENLVSVVLYGSAARDDYHEQYSDVNVMVVLRDLSPTATGAGRSSDWWSHEEKLRPADHHDAGGSCASRRMCLPLRCSTFSGPRTLSGEDVVSAIEVPMNLHRVEVEHDLRTTLLRLRQHLLLTAGQRRRAASWCWRSRSPAW